MMIKKFSSLKIKIWMMRLQTIITHFSYVVPLAGIGPA